MEDAFSSISPPTEDAMARASGIAKRAAENWARYLRGSTRSFTIIRESLEDYCDQPITGARVLDWGSSLGAVSILMDQAGAEKVIASDVDTIALDWLRQAYPEIETSTLAPSETLPFSDKSFDIIFGLSILTHIPPEWQDFYVRELARVLSDNGTLVLTVASYTALEAPKKEGRDPKYYPADDAALDRVGVFYEPYPETLLKKMDFAEKASYGITFHSSAAIQDLFSPHFDIVSASERRIGNQDVIVLRHKG